MSKAFSQNYRYTALPAAPRAANDDYLDPHPALEALPEIAAGLYGLQKPQAAALERVARAVRGAMGRAAIEVLHPSLAAIQPLPAAGVVTAVAFAALAGLEGLIDDLQREGAHAEAYHLLNHLQDALDRRAGLIA